MIVYLDSSAALKLILQEAESSALESFTHDLLESNGQLVSCRLLVTEILRIAATRNFSIVEADAVLDKVDFLVMDEWTFRTAGLIPTPGLRSLDAIHVAAAIQLKADAVLTYDHRMISAVQQAGLSVLSPGREKG